MSLPSDRPHVRVDPAQRFGQPAVKNIAVETVGDMLAAEGDVATLAGEYGLTRADVLVACWYLGSYGTRRWRRMWGQWARLAGEAMWSHPDCDYDAIPDPPNGREDQTHDE